MLTFVKWRWELRWPKLYLLYHLRVLAFLPSLRGAPLALSCLVLFRLLVPRLLVLSAPLLLSTGFPLLIRLLSQPLLFAMARHLEAMVLLSHFPLLLVFPVAVPSRVLTAVAVAVTSKEAMGRMAVGLEAEEVVADILGKARIRRATGSLTATYATKSPTTRRAPVVAFSSALCVSVQGTSMDLTALASFRMGNTSGHTPSVDIQGVTRTYDQTSLGGS